MMSDDAVFNEEDFMSQAADAMDTQYQNCPEGQFQAVIESVKAPRAGLKDKNGNPFYPAEVQWNILDENVKKELGRDKVLVRQTLFLDITNGKLDFSKGKNVPLGILRDAINQNVAGWTFGQLVGAGPALVTVKHDTGKDGVTRAGVTKVAKAA
jgi:hypothetical protein